MLGPTMGARTILLRSLTIVVLWSKASCWDALPSSRLAKTGPFTSVSGSRGSFIARTPSREYCKWEVFNATCPRDEVILMIDARYGRMRFGRCVQEDHGSVGCSADVLAHLDRKCSGLHSCRLTIPDGTLHAMHTCPKELIPYLEASYDCIKVKTGNIHTCSVFGGLPVTSPSSASPVSAPDGVPPPTPARVEGYLSSLTPLESLVGTADCPWLIEARPGQKINLIGFSFDWGVGLGRAECLRGIVVHEPNSTTLIPTCAVDARERHYYTSTMHSLKLYVQFFHELDTAGHQELDGAFLIKYQVRGCPDITWIANTWVRRSGDRATITCNVTGETFYVTCDVTRWLMDVINCTGARRAALVSASPELRQIGAKDAPLTHNLLTTVVLGMTLGVVLGVIILACVLAYKHRHPSHLNPADLEEPEYGSGYHGHTKEPLLGLHGYQHPPDPDDFRYHFKSDVGKCTVVTPTSMTSSCSCPMTHIRNSRRGVLPMKDSGVAVAAAADLGLLEFCPSRNTDVVESELSLAVEYHSDREIELFPGSDENLGVAAASEPRLCDASEVCLSVEYSDVCKPLNEEMI